LYLASQVGRAGDSVFERAQKGKVLAVLDKSTPNMPSLGNQARGWRTFLMVADRPEDIQLEAEEVSPSSLCDET